MSSPKIMRRAAVSLTFNGRNVTKEAEPYIQSLQFNDAADGAADELQIKLTDVGGGWLNDWLGWAMTETAKNERAEETEEADETEDRRKVLTASAARSRPGEQYTRYGIVTAGTVITVTEERNGWCRFIFGGKPAWVLSSGLQKASPSASSAKSPERWLTVSATIAVRNYDGNGSDKVLNCGEFEADSFTASSPPTTASIKAVSLPLSSPIKWKKKTRSWESYNLRDMAAEMAEEAGMGLMFLTAKNPNYARIEQSAQTDIQLLNTLSAEAGCLLKVSNNCLVFYDEGQGGRKRIEFADGSYSKYSLSAGNGGTYTACRVYYTDGSGTVEGTDKTADWSEDNNRLLTVRKKVSSPAEAMQQASAILKLENRFKKTATFTMPGNPDMVSGKTVELSGFGAWDGDYLLSESSHTVSGSGGYTTQIKLTRGSGS